MDEKNEDMTSFKKECGCCGLWFLNSDITYFSEINGDETDMWVCKYCEKEMER